MSALLQLNNLLKKVMQDNHPLTAEEIVTLITNYQFLPRLLGVLIIERAISSCTCTTEETDKAYQQFWQQHQITTAQERQSWLDGHYLTREQLQDWVTRQQRIERFKQTNWSQQVNSYFQQRKPQLDRVIYSFIQVSDGDLALELYFRLREGEASFAELARQYSQSIQAHAGGLIGPVELGNCPAALAKLLARSKTGQIWPPQTIGRTVVIIKLEQYISTQLDSQMQQRLLDELFDTWLQEQITNLRRENWALLEKVTNETACNITP